ncbi:MAG: haloacid dehalogenase type II [Hyphomicrobiaceae bacterium]
MKLTDFSTLSFDCYGTLIDWETGMIENLAPLTSQVSRELGRDEILDAHGRHESAQQADTPSMNYRQILSTVYMRLAAEWGVKVDNAACAAYGNSVEKWPAFPDSAEALAYLKQHYKLVILSNIDRASFAASNEKLGVTFDAIVTAEDVGSYKPATQNFDVMLRELSGMGIGKKDILHTAESLFHDHTPANKVGLASAWIHRRHAQSGSGATRPVGDMPNIDFRFTSMQAMADAHRQEVSVEP